MVKQFKPFIDARALDIIHPDISYAGGITRLPQDRRLRGAEPHSDGSAQHRDAGADLRVDAPGRQSFRTSTARSAAWAVPAASTRRWRPDNPPVIKNSLFQLPEGPGLGLEIDPAYMREHTPKGEDWA